MHGTANLQIKTTKSKIWCFQLFCFFYSTGKCWCLNGDSLYDLIFLYCFGGFCFVFVRVRVCVYHGWYLCEDQKLEYYTCGGQQYLMGTKDPSPRVGRRVRELKYGFNVRVTIKMVNFRLRVSVRHLFLKVRVSIMSLRYEKQVCVRECLLCSV